MECSTRSLQQLIEEFQKLPGIGRKSAERLAYYVLRAPREEALGLADAIRRVKETLRNCSVCFNIAEKEVCSICDDAARDRSRICVVEQPKDISSIEESGSYRGLYHVLQGAFSPLDGVSPEDLTLGPLFRRLQDDAIEEVVLATSTDFEGEGTALYLREEIRRRFPRVRVTRIARGMPSGSHLEHVSRTIVSDAIEGRREMD
ncbi:MAG: recombination protein RecR [Planctomycetes bacterium]|nr:recombination protein RecR [Planctomycetota bacterium]